MRKAIIILCWIAMLTPVAAVVAQVASQPLSKRAVAFGQVASPDQWAFQVALSQAITTLQKDDATSAPAVKAAYRGSLLNAATEYMRFAGSNRMTAAQVYDAVSDSQTTPTKTLLRAAATVLVTAAKANAQATVAAANSIGDDLK